VRHFGQQNVQQQVAAHKRGTATILGRPIFDTELNFGLAGPGATPPALYPPELSETLIWRAYIDSARLGIDSTTWYLYTADVYRIGGQPMGVQLYGGQPTVGAYAEARNLLLRGFTPFRGCTNLGANGAATVQSCELPGADLPSVTAQGTWIGKSFIVFAEDAFGGAQASQPFRTLFYEPLVGGSLRTLQDVRAVSSAPVLVQLVQGIS